MKISFLTLKTWYTRLFVLFFFGALLFVSFRTLADGATISGFDAALWGSRKLIAQTADFRLALGDRVFPNVLVGQNNWLIFTAESSLTDYQNKFTLTDDKIESIQQKLAALQAELAQKNAILLVLIVPNKETIYPEIVPAEIAIFPGPSRLERLSAFLAQNGPAVLLDLRPVLQQARAGYEIYYKTDTHWNDYGVYLAYQAILQELSKKYPQLQPYPLESFKQIPGGPELLDLARNTGSVRLLEQPVQLTPTFPNPASFRQIETGGRRLSMAWVADDALPRLLMYHDSFGPRLGRLLAMHFSQSVFVPHYSGRAIWSTDWIKQQRPDVVIIEFAERYLQDLDVLLSQ